ncbi:MAG: hypothetical protein VBE63_03455 [Lamprobacter sp.]|uniref:hypothetical protein n=1 Tax=Lamprobacter sp. TaxID=3100796 RepID=UPI002B261773|nr:hypothetical protein [Lamprobacter sp.]MEA3638981.1 hypothetical protein [Lamprobacter sp.]
MTMKTEDPMLRYLDHQQEIDALLRRFKPLQPIRVRAGETIPGSYWGAPEAGLIGSMIYLREDTPVHSALHEAGHFVCMDAARRAALQTDAGGDFAEEDAVCYLQVLMAEQLPAVGAQRLFADMDAWGYSFRFGSSAAWFEQDADEAREWLLRHQLIDDAGCPSWCLRI